MVDKIYMPAIARLSLLKSLRDNGYLGSVLQDFRTICGINLSFISEHPLPQEFKKRPHLATPVSLHANCLGYLVWDQTEDEEKDESLRRMVEMAATHLECSLSGKWPHEEDALPSTISLAARFLQDHFQEAVCLDEVAQHVNLSPERLSRLFHRTLGITFSEYLNQLRLDTCRKLLRETRLPITEIAFSAGFQSLSQFNRRFKAAEGASPSDYRAKQAAASHPVIGKSDRTIRPSA